MSFCSWASFTFLFHHRELVLPAHQPAAAQSLSAFQIKDGRDVIRAVTASPGSSIKSGGLCRRKAKLCRQGGNDPPAVGMWLSGPCSPQLRAASCRNGSRSAPAGRGLGVNERPEGADVTAAKTGLGWSHRARLGCVVFCLRKPGVAGEISYLENIRGQLMHLKGH